MAFTFSTDGVELFRKGKKHSVWPLMLVCLNLPPAIRFKQENVLCLGIMPGPSKPKDIDSFLRPMIDEFKLLQIGVENVWDASFNSYFTLKAHIVAITGDMPARDDLMGLSGLNSKFYCNYCKAEGVYAERHIYCPLSPPDDPPIRPVDSEPVRWKQYHVTPLLRTTGKRQREGHSSTLPLRMHQEWKTVAASISNNPIEGVKRRSIFFELTSVLFPWYVSE